MNIQTASPVEFDTALAKVYARLSAAEFQAARIAIWLAKAHENLAKYEAAGRTYYIGAETERIEKLTDQQAEAEAKASEVRGEARPFEVTFAERGGWPRYYLVDNTNGHVHKSIHPRCDTCYPTTQYAWLVEQSGMTAEELVELAGEKACTVCFPWAPVDTLNRSTKLEAPERKAARLEREAKAAEKAEKARIAGITDAETGGPLIVKRFSYNEEIKTLRTAKSWLTDWADGWSSIPAESIAKIVAAVAKKEGKTEDEVRAEARKRAAKRK